LTAKLVVVLSAKLVVVLAAKGCNIAAGVDPWVLTAELVVGLLTELVGLLTELVGLLTKLVIGLLTELVIGLLARELSSSGLLTPLRVILLLSELALVALEWRLLLLLLLLWPGIELILLLLTELTGLSSLTAVVVGGGLRVSSLWLLAAELTALSPLLTTSKL
jgi:hypothetical protein